jgi:hypothetical protein
VFPEEGKQHFREQAKLHHDPIWEYRREMNALLIQEIVKRRCQGQDTGDDMDLEIFKEPWFVDAMAAAPEGFEVLGRDAGVAALLYRLRQEHSKCGLPLLHPDTSLYDVAIALLKYLKEEDGEAANDKPL